MPRQLSRRRSAPAALDPQDGVNDYDEEETEDRPARRGARDSRRGSRVGSDRPARSRRPLRGDEPDEVYGNADADYDERPARNRSSGSSRKRQRPAAQPCESGRGWDRYKEAKARGSKFNDANKFNVEEGVEELIAFLEEEPFETWNEHFIRELDGRKSFVCVGDGCPLCAWGDTPGYRAAFNIAVFGSGGNPSVKYWVATPNPLDAIEDHAFSERTGPLNGDGNFYIVSKKKQKNKTFGYKVEHVDEDEAAEFLDADPPTRDELDDLLDEHGFDGKDVLRLDPKSKLAEAARELSD